MFEKIIEEVASGRDLQKRYPRNCLIQKRIKLFTTYDITNDSRNVVYQTNVKNLMDRKETQCNCIERGGCSKITVENN